MNNNLTPAAKQAYLNIQTTLQTAMHDAKALAGLQEQAWHTVLENYIKNDPWGLQLANHNMTTYETDLVYALNYDAEWLYNTHGQAYQMPSLQLIDDAPTIIQHSDGSYTLRLQYTTAFEQDPNKPPIVQQLPAYSLEYSQYMIDKLTPTVTNTIENSSALAALIDRQIAADMYYMAQQTSTTQSKSSMQHLLNKLNKELGEAYLGGWRKEIQGYLYNSNNYRRVRGPRIGDFYNTNSTYHDYNYLSSFGGPIHLDNKGSLATDVNYFKSEGYYLDFNNNLMLRSYPSVETGLKHMVDAELQARNPGVTNLNNATNPAIDDTNEDAFINILREIVGASSVLHKMIINNYATLVSFSANGKQWPTWVAEPLSHLKFMEVYVSPGMPLTQHNIMSINDLENVALTHAYKIKATYKI